MMNERILGTFGLRDPEQSLTMRDLLAVLFRRKRILFAAVGLTVILTAVGTVLTPPCYEAKAQVYVQRERPDAVDLGDGRLGRPVLRRSDVINSEVTLIRSRGVVEPAVEALRLWERPTPPSLRRTVLRPLKNALVTLGLWVSMERREKTILQVQQLLRVRGEPDSDVISIACVHTDAELSASIVNSVLDAYLRKRQESHISDERVQFFTEQLLQATLQLDTLTAARTAVKRQWNIVSIDQEKRLILDALTLTENRLQEALGSAREADRTHAVLAAETARLPERILETTETEHSELFDELTAMVARLEARQAEQLVKWPPHDPRVLEVTQQLDAIMARLATLDAVTPSVQRHSINTLRTALLEREKLVSAQLAGLRAKVDEYSEQRTRQLERLLMLDEREDDLDELDERIAAGRAKRNVFRQRVEEARVQGESGPNFANVWVINRASVPQRPTLMPLVAIGIGLGLGTVLAGILIAAAEYFDHTIHNREDVQRHLGVPVVAAVPQHRR